MKLRIKEAIVYFNENRKANEQKLNNITLGIVVLPEMTPKTSGYYISRWSHGFEYGKLKPENIIGICEKTGVDVNFLFGYTKNKV